jgi:pimeloyl-ACP methyl ester carboxylesterase
VEFATNPADGVRIAYRTFGDTGPAVVLVHGSALSQVIWRGFGYVRDLAADHRVVTLDLRGHGRSDKPHEEPAYRLELFVGDVLAVLDALGIDTAHYVGYSLGGRVGFSLIDANPGRVLTFVNIAGAPGNRPGAFDRVFFPGCTHAIETGGMGGFLDGWKDFSGGSLDAQTRAAFAANDPQALAAYMRASENDDGVPAERLAVFGAHSLMLVGSQDAERLRAAEYVHGIAPDAALTVIPGAGHGDVLRHPRALPAVRAFIDPPVPQI